MSSSTAFSARPVTVTLLFASAADASRWIVPRVSTVVVASATPSCTTLRPASVMSPSGARSRPVLLTCPAVLSGRNCGATSLPRVVEKVFSAVPCPGRTMKKSPAANCACPRGVVTVPALCTSLPISST
ncbi:hypothetical protein D9M68_967200 [compost metagenome]